MDAVAELVGEGHDVAPAGGEVEQDVRVRGGHGRMRERTALLARHDRCVDVAVEEARGDLGHLGRERPVRVQHGASRLGPVDLALVGQEWRVAVVLGELVEAEQAALEPVPASGDVVAGRDRFDQCLHGGVLDLVAQVPRRDPRPVVAQAVVDRMVGQDRVEDERPHREAGLEGLGDGTARPLADLAVRYEQLGQSLLEGDRLLVEGDRHRVGDLGEQPYPRRPAGDGLLGHDLLLGLAEEVRAKAAGGGQEVAPALEGRIGQQLGRLFQR